MVLPANVTYPTDSGLLVRAITLIVTLVARIHAAGAASRTGVRDRRRAAGRRARSISAHLKLRNDEAKARVLAITGELADLTEATVADATRVLVNARRHIARREGRCVGAAGRGRRRPGNHAGAGHPSHRSDPDPARRGRPRNRRPGWCPCTTRTPARSPRAGSANRSSSGTRRRSWTTPTGSCWTTACTAGNPADAPLLAPAIARIAALLGRAPRAVTADRGYGEAKIDEALTELGVKNVVIPRKGKPSAARRATEHARGFRRLVKWRTGSEGRISYLKSATAGTAPCSTGCPARRPGAGSAS